MYTKSEEKSHVIKSVVDFNFSSPPSALKYALHDLIVIMVSKQVAQFVDAFWGYPLTDFQGNWLTPNLNFSHPQFYIGIFRSDYFYGC